MSRKKRGLLALLTFLFATLLHSQEIPAGQPIAEERIQVTASSATVLQWFGYIERQLDLTLSYNPSLIDLQKTCRITASGQMTVSQLLALVLEGYRFRTPSSLRANWPSRFIARRPTASAGASRRKAAVNGSMGPSWCWTTARKASGTP